MERTGSIHQMAPFEMDPRLSDELIRIAVEFAAHTATEVDFYTKGEELPFITLIRLTFIRCL